MSTLLAVITCRPSFFSFCQARQFSILRRSTQLVGVLTRHKEYKVFDFCLELQANEVNFSLFILNM